MKKVKYKSFISAFLLIVFSLNTVVGFACAIGIDMGFNSSHHGEMKELSDNDHHEDEQNHHELSTHHNHSIGHHHESNKEDNCCNHHVINLSQLDKAIPQSFKLTSQFSTAFIPIYFKLSPSYTSSYIISTKYFVRSHHPPIPDIRIAIQSFQI